MVPKPLRAAALPAALMLAAVAASPLAAQQGAAPGARSGSQFDSLQQRGRVAMGVDQYTSAHRFDDLADGGRIELQRDSTDAAGVQTIRQHLAEIARAFSKGDFQTPAFVHAGQVPGVEVMRARRHLIRYEYHPLPGGGEVRITTTDPEAIRAVHEFLAFQRSDHRSPGKEHHGH